MLDAKKGGDLTPAVFTYGDAQQVRMLVIEDQPWFAAKDVCSVLGIANSRRVAASLDDDEVRVYGLRTPSGRQQMQLVNESGLYNLIFRSRKAEARAFRRWVTAEVLPSIRRSGGYQQPQAQPPVLPPGQPAALPQAAAAAHTDARHLPYDLVAWRNGQLRMLPMAGRQWYSLSDVVRCLGGNNRAHGFAKKLPKSTVRSILIFGQAHPMWFVDDTGLRMVAAMRGHRLGQHTLDFNASKP